MKYIFVLFVLSIILYTNAYKTHNDHCKIGSTCNGTNTCIEDIHTLENAWQHSDCDNRKNCFNDECEGLKKRIDIQNMMNAKLNRTCTSGNTYQYENSPTCENGQFIFDTESGTYINLNNYNDTLRKLQDAKDLEEEKNLYYMLKRFGSKSNNDLNKIYSTKKNVLNQKAVDWIGNFSTVANETDISRFNSYRDFLQQKYNFSVITLDQDVTSLYKLFYKTDSYSEYAYANVANWNTSSVTNMSFTFEGTRNFNQYIGNWTTSSVTTMCMTMVWSITSTGTLETGLPRK